MSSEASDFWQRMGGITFLFLAALAWSTLLWSPERSSRELSSETTAFEFYLTGNYAASYETLMRTELWRRSLDESSAGAVERLLFDLYMEPSLKLDAQKLADAFNLLLSRQDLPPSRRSVWEVYEAELLTLHRESYSVEAFLNRVEGLQRARKSAAEKKPVNTKRLQRMNEAFRVYFHHGLKKWHEESELVRPNLRWLFASGLAGSMYYAQGRDQLEAFIEQCGRLSCRGADVAKAKEVLKLIGGLEPPLGEEHP